jgi:GNAT superfamily N-acetyltransferase
VDAEIIEFGVRSAVRFVMQIRHATAADAEEIHRIHDVAIRVLCAADYTPMQIESWVHYRSVADYRRALQSGESNWVATDNTAILGYATSIPGELTALFIDPLHAGRGIGSSLLFAVEDHATRQRSPRLILQSTKTAQKFYHRHGYTPGNDEIYTLPDGVHIECVRMTKLFDGNSPNRTI